MPYSPLDSALLEKLAEYKTAYNQAEKALKIYEIFSNEGLIFPAVNELRYAGQHVVRSLTAPSLEEAAECIVHATRHARRAIYDAYDAGIIYFLDSCKLFQNNYKNVVISEVIQDYISERQKLEQIKNDISKEDRQKLKENYAEIKESQFQAVQAIATKWALAEDELNKKISQSITANRRFIVTIAVAIIVGGIPVICSIIM